MAKKIRGKKEGSISQRPNGSWRAQISLHGKRLSYSAKTKQECLVWLREKQNQIDKGLSYDSSKIALAEYMAGWLASAKASLRYTTWTQYQRVTELYILPGIGKMKLADLKPDHVQRLYDQLLVNNIGNIRASENPYRAPQCAFTGCQNGCSFPQSHRFGHFAKRASQ